MGARAPTREPQRGRVPGGWPFASAGAGGTRRPRARACSPALGGPGCGSSRLISGTYSPLSQRPGDTVTHRTPPRSRGQALARQGCAVGVNQQGREGKGPGDARTQALLRGPLSGRVGARTVLPVLPRRASFPQRGASLDTHSRQRSPPRPRGPRTHRLVPGGPRGEIGRRSGARWSLACLKGGGGSGASAFYLDGRNSPLSDGSFLH